MERIGLRREPSRDFDHPNVDADAYPQLVRHVFYALGRDEVGTRRAQALMTPTMISSSRARAAGWTTPAASSSASASSR